jgi:hypothetical protein
LNWGWLGGARETRSACWIRNSVPAIRKQKRMKENHMGGHEGRKGEWALLLVLLVLILAVLFHRSFSTGQIIFANDGPLGANNANSLAMPSAFVSVWRDLNSVGGYSGSFLLPVTGVLLWFLKPLGFAKLYVPLVFLLLGCSAGLFFRRLRLAPAACIFGGIAAALNSEFFSTACWGIAIPATALSACFLALAAVTGNFQCIPWARLALAGFAVGICVMEAADVGAIFSVFVAAFIAYGTLTVPGSIGKKLGLAVLQVGCVAVFALFMAAQTVTGMIETQIQGVAAAKQDEATKAARWDEATEWSFPKSEVISLVMPGIFGYGISPREGHAEDQYWGRVGQHRTQEEFLKNGKTGPVSGFLRHTGTGFYAGIMVVMVGLWAAAQSFRKQGSVFELAQRKAVWFWLGMFIVSLLLAFGRYAPFYRFFFSLPYASTIRNPIKFMHTLNWALVVMFAYGVHGLVAQYLKSPAQKDGNAPTPKIAWWRRISSFDRKWLIGCAALFVISLITVAIYAQSGKQLVNHLSEVGFPDPATAKAIADQSIEAALLFILRFAVALGAIFVIMGGWFAGSRSRWGAVLLGLVLAGDLASADAPWIKYQNFDRKYASNPIIDLLREKPYEHRVAVLPFAPPREAPMVAQQVALLDGYYRIEWHQILFQYYNIQSLEVVQMSRTPEDLEAYQKAMTPYDPQHTYLITRNWQLSNTRYLLGATALANGVNDLLDPVQKRFRILQTFDVTNKPGIDQTRMYEDLTAVPLTNGPFAVYEFTGALPRAKLFSNWEVNTNDPAVLQELASESFDPLKTVLVASNVPPPSATSTNQDAGNVEFTSYDTKHIVFKAEAKTPAVLLFNDKYDPNWQVTVDGKRAQLLRCNFIMRGVYLTPGTHVVDFRFVISNKPLYFTLAAAALGILLLGLLASGRVNGKSPDAAPSAAAGTPDKSTPG